jgi:ParB family chromosome partitioning protein
MPQAQSLPSTPRQVPLSKLYRSEFNGRRTGLDDGQHELQASILEHGLLQRLIVHAGTGGRFGVAGGDRRLTALQALAKAKKIPKGYLVDCNEVDLETARAVSLAENVVRVAMHPADQLDAWAALITDGKAVEDVARQFGVSSQLVQQRLKLASVAPALMEEFRADKIALDTIKAFTLSDDHAAQIAAWESARHMHHPHQQVRRILTEDRLPLTDPRVRFIGLAAFEAAGGVIDRDLFDVDTGWISDTTLLCRMAMERLDREADAVRAEGWGEVKLFLTCPYAEINEMSRRPGQLSPEDQARIGALVAQLAAIPENDQDEQWSIEEEIQSIEEEGARTFATEDLAACCAFVFITSSGELEIERGLAARVRPEPGPAKADAPSVDASARLSDALTGELSAHRTAGFQATLAEQPGLAFLVLVHSLILKTFDAGSFNAALLTLHGWQPELKSACPSIESTPARQFMEKVKAV